MHLSGDVLCHGQEVTRRFLRASNVETRLNVSCRCESSVLFRTAMETLVSFLPYTGSEDLNDGINLLLLARLESSNFELANRSSVQFLYLSLVSFPSTTLLTCHGAQHASIRDRKCWSMSHRQRVQCRARYCSVDDDSRSGNML